VIWSREDDISLTCTTPSQRMYMEAALGRMESPLPGYRERFSRPSDRRSTRGANYSDPGELGLGSPDVPFAVANLRAENGAGDGARSNRLVPIGRQRLSTRSAFIRLPTSWLMRGARILSNTCCNCSGRTGYSKNEIAKDYPNYVETRALSDRYRAVPASADAGSGKGRVGESRNREMATEWEWPCTAVFLTSWRRWFRCR